MLELKGPWKAVPVITPTGASSHEAEQGDHRLQFAYWHCERTNFVCENRIDTRTRALICVGLLKFVIKPVFEQMHDADNGGGGGDGGGGPWVVMVGWWCWWWWWY